MDRRIGSSAATLAPCQEAEARVRAWLEQARQGLAGRLGDGNGTVTAAAIDREQFACHGLAWMATTAEALRQALGWAGRLEQDGKFRPLERGLLLLGFCEYMAQLDGGIPMSQGEIVRPGDLGVPGCATGPGAGELGTIDTAVLRQEVADLIAGGDDFGDPGLDGDLALAAAQFRRFSDDRVAPLAHDWHLQDALIPDSVIAGMAELGVFGLSVPEAYGGTGLGKLAVCVASEVFSRGSLGVGSLGTRAEIAGELIASGGLPEQGERWLPGIAAGTILPTAVFTEPDAGSDLAALRTRAVRDGDVYRVTGAKTWITHAARADLMTMLVRTDPAQPGHRGLSMLVVEKPRGTGDDPFPVPGIRGSEIPVLGYRGMKEYELSLDGLEVPVTCLLGGVEGQGFRQLMQTFESARIQTAARALGVAQAAMEAGLAYARSRKQFGREIYAFPRISGKLAWMAAETMMARQLGYYAARCKDAGRRCDLEAGMAKLLAARVAWANADNALQIHGGNGYALEYPVSRILCDARILGIFEGAAEIQAQVIARRLLGA